MKGINEDMVETRSSEISSRNWDMKYSMVLIFLLMVQHPMRELYSDVVITERLRDAIYHLNPDIPPTAKEEAVKKILTN